MRVLVLGHGKTGKLVADVASERGHGVHVLDAKENPRGSALTAPFVAGFDVVIDFTTPEAVLTNLRACLAVGAKVVVGTTGWYNSLHDMSALALRKEGALLHGTNYSIGVQVMLKIAKQMAEPLRKAGYEFKIEETHHVTKLDAPSGTAISLQQALVGAGEVPITSVREGDVPGLHIVEAVSGADRLLLTHEAFSRRGFAEGAVRGAEWLSTRKGVYDFSDIFTEL
ncbi:dihydrodipicolinate reductase [Terriglobus roseus DSM 18391]|uniref:4-hydroxy-tetrahydrodipicolinate reductase n=1 Tax=Terriglobus roseus (strain DSM 18391 / NRRL B-41598 / KBS 63) TaxID=926566 RepID=I3ZJT6_TERRK|nr:dihydrodipicolinate reductase C-terminal domain-containing protein [Terriglobus roseus]AFL89504.1 dihydrodipicolinate reductase [Terriglobus roseus DSM 18391]